MFIHRLNLRTVVPTPSPDGRTQCPLLLYCERALDPADGYHLAFFIKSNQRRAGFLRKLC